MKKRWRVVALGICMAMLTCACSTQAEKEDTSSTQQNGEKKETAEEKAEKAKQAAAAKAAEAEKPADKA